MKDLADLLKSNMKVRTSIKGGPIPNSQCVKDDCK
jgi:hypothetical protein